MPTVKMFHSHVKPHRIIAYITRPDKSPCWDTMNIIGQDRLSYADQIRATQNSFGKPANQKSSPKLGRREENVAGADGAERATQISRHGVPA